MILKFGQNDDTPWPRVSNLGSSLRVNTEMARTEEAAIKTSVRGLCSARVWG